MRMGGAGMGGAGMGGRAVGTGGGAGHCPHDVEYQVMSDRYTRGTKTVRVEVKASISAKGDWTKHKKLMFSYQGVKPNNFDYIFLYEVNPFVGVIAKWTTRKHIPGLLDPIRKKCILTPCNFVNVHHGKM